MKANPYLGSSAQAFDIRSYQLTDGTAAGVRGVDVWNGEIHFTILPDRCMDLYSVRYKGNNMSFLTPAGIVHPAYHTGIGMSWHRAFGGGMLATCGLQNIGATDDTPDLTIHGRIGNLPAKNLCIDMDEDGMGARISGTMTETMLFGATLTLTRTYQIRAGENTIRFTDVIENKGFETVPISLLYHFNLGYPLISEHATAVIPAYKTLARNAHAEEGLDSIEKILPPTPGFEEMVYYHFLNENVAGVDNPDIDTSFRLSFTSDYLLDRMAQWKMFGEGAYVMGLEPGSCSLDGRKAAIKDGSQKYIEPGQVTRNTLTLTFSELGGTQ